MGQTDPEAYQVSYYMWTGYIVLGIDADKLRNFPDTAICCGV